MLRKQAQHGSDRLKKPRTRADRIDRLGSDRLKKLGTGSDEDRSAGPEGRWIDIP